MFTQTQTATRHSPAEFKYTGPMCLECDQEPEETLNRDRVCEKCASTIQDDAYRAEFLKDANHDDFLELLGEMNPSDLLKLRDSAQTYFENKHASATTALEAGESAIKFFELLMKGTKK